MPEFDDLAADIDATMLGSFGYAITYIPNRGVGDPIEMNCLLKPPAIEQSISPGYFGDIEIDPLLVPSPQKGDQVVWSDGITYYTVTKVLDRPLGLTTVAIHRRYDP